jgi:hypothetical protein
VRQSVTLITPATLTPVASDQLVAWARLNNEDEDDATLNLLIATATDSAERFLNRSLINCTLKLTLDLPPSGLQNSLSGGVYDLPVSILNGCLKTSIDLPRGPVSAISSVTTYDTDDAETTFDSGNYTLDASGSRLLLKPDASWPSNLRPLSAVAITYVAGYGATTASVPAAIRNGILIHAASLYEQRGQCEDAMDIPPGAKQLYKQYRVFGGTVA